LASDTAETLANRTLPARAGAAARVISIIDDAESGIGLLVNAIGADPALAAKVLTVANSAYYGLSRRVGSLQYAISVVGYDTVRALTVPILAGLDDPSAVPTRFWEQAASAAVAGQLTATILDANPADAFCAGLLHTIGSALLHQQSPLPSLCLPLVDDEQAFIRTEIEQYGVSHAEVGAQALVKWRFPPHLIELVADHHEVSLSDAQPLARVLQAARLLTDLNLAGDRNRIRNISSLLRLSEGELTEPRVASLVEQVQQQSEALLVGLRA
jgi:HD-like signal output (HDOD) protein